MRNSVTQVKYVMTTFVAIDFETADYERDSACAVGAVLVENGRITERYHQLIRPPRTEFVFTYIHGLTWNDVRDSLTFGQMWPELNDFIDEAEFLVAHNAPFDRGVLQACCDAAKIVPPRQQFLCTVQTGPFQVEPAVSEATHRLQVPADPLGSSQRAI